MNEINRLKITVDDNNFITVRTWSDITDDSGNIIAQTTPHQVCLHPGQSAPDGADQKVLDAIATFHTEQVIADYQASLPAVEEPIV